LANRTGVPHLGLGPSIPQTELEAQVSKGEDQVWFANNKGRNQMTDTTNTLPPLPEPAGTVWDYDRYGEGCEFPSGQFTEFQMHEYGDARAAHAVAQTKVETEYLVSEYNRLHNEVVELRKAREVTDAEIDALLKELNFYPAPSQTSVRENLHRIVRAAIALANGRDAA